MRASLTATALTLMGLAGGLSAQKAEPLRKTDLIRLLSAGTMSTAEIADLIKRNCVSFTPTARDRENLTSLGADSAIFARIDACVRARTTAAAPHAAPPRAAPAAAAAVAATAAAPTEGLVAVPLVSQLSVPVGGVAEIGVALKRGTKAVPGARVVLLGSAGVAGGAAHPRDAEAVTDAQGVALFRIPAGTQPGVHRLSFAMASGEAVTAMTEVELATVPASPGAAAAAVGTRTPAAAGTDFVVGFGQRGMAGQHAPQPVVLEVRDSSGTPIVAFPVTWTVTNGDLLGAVPTTDTAGHARTEVVFGSHVGPTVVTATAGSIIRHATLYAGPGKPAKLVVERGGVAVDQEVLVSTDGTTLLRVYCRDGFNNPLPLTDLTAAAGDQDVVHVTAVTTDSIGGWVTLRPGKDGTTILTLQGAGIRADLSAVVRH